MSETQKIEAKIKKIEKTDLDDGIRATKKIKIHLVCLLVGISISVGVSFADGALVHIALCFSALPSIVQEVFDYLYKL